MRALYDFHLLPQEYLALDDESKAFLIAAIKTKDEIDEKDAKEMERQAR
jgi:hypothetical protein